MYWTIRHMVQTSCPAIYLFLHLKKHLAGKKFDDEVEEEVMTWLKGRRQTSMT
jgi:hypothetical protein